MGLRTYIIIMIVFKSYSPFQGSDGLQYLKSIGGITIAQDPSTAPLKTMPENAIATGKVDSICTPDEIK